VERQTSFWRPHSRGVAHDTTDVTTFDGWRTQTGFADLRPRTQVAHPRDQGRRAPEQYEPGRANIIVYNWEQQSAVSVDVSGILNRGDRYVVQNAEDFYGPSTASGIYTGRPLDYPWSASRPRARRHRHGSAGARHRTDLQRVRSS